MSLTGALQTARSGLAVTQAALQVVGNNLANAATKGYSRQSAVTVASGAEQAGAGTFLGTGVQLQAVVRSVDEALNARERFATSDHEAALAQQGVLSQIENTEDSLGDNSLSDQLSAYFTSWSQLSANPTNTGLRTLVVSQGSVLASNLKSLRSDLATVRTSVDDSIRSGAQQANDLLGRIATLNQQIVTSESGAGGANSLHDQRDQLLTQLAALIPISTVQQPSGSVDVYVNSVPVVIGAQSRGIQAEFKSEDTGLTVRLRVTADGTQLDNPGGKLGALIQSREDDVNATIDKLDEFTGQVISQVNQAYSSGQGEQGFTTLTGTYLNHDPAAALNNAAATGLAFTPKSGSFQLNVTQKSTGQRLSTQVNINLNGDANDTTLADVASQINAAGNVSASLTADGRLKIDSTSSDFEFSFADDTSGALAALGVNTFFTGKDATDIGVNGVLSANPALLATNQGNVKGDNRNAIAIAAILDAAPATAGGVSLRQAWLQHTEDMAIHTQTANQRVDATGVVADSLASQRESVSGVNIDEESIDMLSFQRAFEGSARFINVVDQMTQTLLGMIQ
jgi:flagellar hook-associated protein 1 FlgK